MEEEERRRELEQLWASNQARKNAAQRGHSPQHSLSDVISYYEETSAGAPPPSAAAAAAPAAAAGLAAGMSSHRPLSYMNAPSERETFKSLADTPSQRRHGAVMDPAPSNQSAAAHSPRRTSPPSPPRAAALPRGHASEKVRSPTDSGSSKSLQRMGSLGSEHTNGQNSPTSPPPLSRQSSTDTAVQHFPLNDIDYESSPAAVAQELSNLQAIRRMSMNVDTADPDLPSFSSGNVPSIPAEGSDDEDEDDPSKLFWVPARLHPELAPKEFKTFIEDRVDKIRRRSGGEDTLSPDGMSRPGSGSGLSRKKSMLSHQIDTKGTYQDGADRLESKRSKGMQVEGQTTVELSDLETLVNDPSQLIRRMSIDQARRSQDSGGERSSSEDMPILPNAGNLKRSTRTTYRRGSLKKGERVLPSNRLAARRRQEHESDVPPSPALPTRAEPVLGLSRVQTEPIPPPKESREPTSKSSPSRRNLTSQSNEDLSRDQDRTDAAEIPALREDERYDERSVSQPSSQPQARQFQSRIASPGRTTAQLPGYNNTNPLPQIIETLPDGTKVPANNLIQAHPERKSSHEVPRHFQRGGAHMRPVPGRQSSPSSTLDDLSSRPSPLPGSGGTRTDALTLVPTFDEKKVEKKDGGRKSSWKWILGSDDGDKDKRSKEDPSPDSSSKSKLSRSSKSAAAEKARLDVLQNSIDGTVPARGRESLVLNREDIKLEDERKKEGKKSSDGSKGEKTKEPSLLSAIFGGKKKTSDSDLKEKKRKADRGHSPEPATRILKPDIDYNWTRFSILEERAIYRMAHIKLANPRRPLHSQVLLSNFMYSYLAKVQMMHPQMQIPAAQRTAQQRNQQEEQQKQQQQQQHPPEYNQYQRWQEEQARQDAANNANSDSGRTSFDMIHEGQQRASLESQQSSGHDRDQGHSDEYGRQLYSSHSGGGQQPRTNGAGASGSGYSVASTHDYLGYSKSEQPFNQQGLWDSNEREEELW